MSGLMRKSLNWYAGLLPKKLGKPPFKHIVQLGDPTLRQKSEAVPLGQIQSHEIKTLVERLKFVQDQYKCLGLSAPQIGVNKRVFLMHVSEKYVQDLNPIIVEKQQVQPISLSVFINPTYKVVNQKLVSFPEGCESIRGFTAEVPRYQAISLSGHNEEGKALTVTLMGWLARIAQHEIDHLDGKVYTDIMNKESFSCMCWQQVNLHQGKIQLPFRP